MLIPLLMLAAACAPPQASPLSSVDARLEGAWKLVASEVIAPQSADGTHEPTTALGVRFHDTWAHR